MFRKITLFVLLISSSLNSNLIHAQTLTGENVQQGTQVEDPSKYPYETVVLDRILYKDRVYGSAGKTQLGDSAELEMSLRYQKDENSFTSFRFETDPTENRKDNETSNFELIYGRKFRDFTFQVDLDLNTSDENKGTSLGLDLDSDDTFISYNLNKKIQYTFFPFNFRSDVGEEFNTKDVSRISYIDGSPTTILATPANDEEVVSKTVPGVEFKYSFDESYLYAGVGVASYLYPTNSNFNIDSNPVATSWEKKEAYAYKLGYLFDRMNDAKINLQYVGQTGSEETGALLAQAASITLFKKMSLFVFKTELTSSKAGEAPYNLSRTTNWFEDITLNKPIYSDINGDKQDWIGKTDYAYLFKVGLQLDKALPYISLKHQGEYFVYNEKESAHTLRIDDESKSHGGLTRIGLGSYFYYDNLSFNPLIEWQQAKNPVFSNSTDVSSDRLQSSFKKENILFSINLTYTFDGANLNQNWWF